jgi:parallel beta helix pectate lyase-like protein
VPVSGPRAATLLLGLALLAIAIPHAAPARTLRVGPGKAYATVRAAAQAARDFDIVLIDAGTYPGDVASWNADHVTVRGIGGRAHLRADGAEEAGKGIWVVNGNGFTAENIEFSGARVPDRNGAGIRADITGKLTVRNCYFHDNENGILAGAGEILIDQCVFDGNGAGDGRTHNMYLWGRTVTVRHTESRRARVGHNLKTRGETNYILYNRIADGKDGTASYSIDIPDRGRTYLIGNVIEQGPMSENRGIVAYGMESASHAPELCVVNNTLVNDHPRGGTFLQLGNGARAWVVNNVFAGPGSRWSGGSVRASRNVANASVGALRFHNPRALDYRLTGRTPRSIVNGGTAPGRSSTGYDLTPRREYVPTARGRNRSVSGPLDLGAFEYTSGR